VTGRKDDADYDERAVRMVAELYGIAVPNETELDSRHQRAPS